MSKIVVNKAQFGTHATAANNFVIKQSDTPDGKLHIQNGNEGSATDVVVLDSAGNVGVGVTPSAWDSLIKVAEFKNGVHFGGQTDSEPVVYLGANAYYNGGAFKYKVSSRPATQYRSYSGLHAWFASTDASPVAGNPITFTQAMTLDASGNLLVGVTSGSSHYLRKNNPSGSALIVSNVSTTSPYGLGITFDGVGGSSGNFLTCGDTGANRLVILGSGNVQNVNNSYGAISDLKLKENITDATPKLDKLNQVRIVNYRLKSDPDHKQLGVIAQELEQVFPGMVEETPDRDAEGNDLGTVTKSVKYSVFVPMLIKALQELTAKVAALENK